MILVITLVIALSAISEAVAVDVKPMIARSLRVKLGAMTHGTATYLKPQYALTNAHVCALNPDYVKTKDQRMYRIRRRIVIEDVRADLCLLHVPDLKGPAAIRLAPEGRHLLGRRVYYVGYPHDVFIIATGIMQFETEIRFGGMGSPRILYRVQGVDMLTGPGASGSGVYDVSGHFVGVVVGFNVTRVGKVTTFIISLHEVRKFLKRAGYFDE